MMPRMTLRAEDASEVRGLGMSPGRALRLSWRQSFYRRAATMNGDFAAAWGVVGAPAAGSGMVWLLTSPLVERIKVTMLAVARDEIAAMLDLFSTLWGLVAASYTKAIRFLGAVGFTVNPAVIIIPRTGAEFHMFRINR